MSSHKPFYRGNQGTERLVNLSKVTQLIVLDLGLKAVLELQKLSLKKNNSVNLVGGKLSQCFYFRINKKVLEVGDQAFFLPVTFCNSQTLIDKNFTKLSFFPSLFKSLSDIIMLNNLCKFRDPSSSSHHLHYTAKRKIRGNVIFWKKKKPFDFLKHLY